MAKEVTIVFCVLGIFALGMGVVMYGSTFSVFSSEIADFFGFHNDPHLMRNTGVFLILMSSLNFYAMSGSFI